MPKFDEIHSHEIKLNQALRLKQMLIISDVLLVFDLIAHIRCTVNCFNQFYPSLFRIESYSCKMIGVDKQLYKKFNADAEGRSPHSLEALSPPQNGFGGYSFRCATHLVYYKS